jgi:membrane protease YdiL (CAAX protease family)
MGTNRNHLCVRFQHSYLSVPSTQLSSIAAINAFNEEFTLRAAPLSELYRIVGKQQALMITSVFFGLGHYYGIPNGVLGVLLSGFLGWFLGKSLLETKGFFWAWLIHFIPDVFIFTFLAIPAAP